MEQRVGVVTRAAAGIKHHRTVQRYWRVGEATDEDLGPHGLPGLVVVAGFARVVLVAAQLGPSPSVHFPRKSTWTRSIGSVKRKFYSPLTSFSLKGRSEGLYCARSRVTLREDRTVWPFGAWVPTCPDCILTASVVSRRT